MHAREMQVFSSSGSPSGENQNGATAAAALTAQYSCRGTYHHLLWIYPAWLLNFLSFCLFACSFHAYFFSILYKLCKASGSPPFTKETLDRNLSGFCTSCVSECNSILSNSPPFCPVKKTFWNGLYLLLDLSSSKMHVVQKGKGLSYALFVSYNF